MTLGAVVAGLPVRRERGFAQGSTADSADFVHHPFIPPIYVTSTTHVYKVYAELKPTTAINYIRPNTPNKTKMSDDRFWGNLAAGFIGGLLVALGGALKDAPYEGFDPATFWRSPVIASVWGVVLGVEFPRTSCVLLGMSTIGLERVTIETMKVGRVKAGTYAPSKFTAVGEWGRAHWSQANP